MLSARTTHLLKPFALALAVAALAAPTAQAKLTPAKTWAVRVRRMRADDDHMLSRFVEGTRHARLVAGVAAAGDVRARDRLEERDIAVDLAEVRVEVDRLVHLTVEA